VWMCEAGFDPSSFPPGNERNFHDMEQYHRAAWPFIGLSMFKVTTALASGFEFPSRVSFSMRRDMLPRRSVRPFFSPRPFTGCSFLGRH
jgi:hypothetical protein